MVDFWIKDYKNLYNNTDGFFPNKNMSRNEILNALSRYAIIMFIIFVCISSNTNWLFLPIGILVGCVLLYYIDIPRQKDEEKIIETLNIKCREPDINNPYMNVLATQNKVDLPGCDHQNVKDQVDKNYKFNLYQNLDDLFDRKHLERQFYTMPVSTIPGSQKKFAEWLYKSDGNCKEDGKRCLEYEDERYH